MGRLVLALAAALVCASPALAAPPYTVVATDGDLDLEALANGAAVGLLVPDAGPTTSERRARAALVRGEVVNSLREERLSGPPLIELSRSGTPGTPILVVQLPRGGPQANDRRYPVALIGAEPGLLTSESTRIPGLVAIADIAHGRLHVDPSDDPAADLRALDARIMDNARTRRWGMAIVAVAVGALAAFSAPAGLLAFGYVLLMNLLLGVAGVSDPVIVALLLVASVFGAWPLARALEGFERRRRDLVIGAGFAAVIALYLVALAADASWVALSPLGPTQNSRFYGLSNTIETILLVPALVGAFLLGRRWGWLAFVGVAVLSLVTVAGSRFGADGGGAIVLAAGFAVLAWGLAGGGRRAVVVASAVVLVALALVSFDALLGPATHVGETVRGGPGELAHDLAARLRLSWRRATDSWRIAVVVFGSVAALAALVTTGPRRALPLAVAAAVAVSLLVNDSPREVAVAGLLAYFVVARVDRARAGQPEVPVYTSS